MRVIGLMSGTSHDAIEVAAADLTMDAGGEVTARLLGARTAELDPDLRAAVAEVLPPAAASAPGGAAEQVCRLDTWLGQAFAATAELADRDLCEGRADLVVSHGQTVYHWVEGGVVRGTLQLGAPAWIAERTGVPVVSDLRTRDVAKGGQGAPLVSLFDTLLLPPAEAPRAALNLGGIANVTVIPPAGAAAGAHHLGGGGRGAGPAAFDVGPANALIDAAVTELTGGREVMDTDGRRAGRGTVRAELLGELLADPYYALPPPKTTGKEHFNVAYLAAATARHSLGGDDLVATLTRLTAKTVADALGSARVTEVVASGGGTRNPVLMDELRAAAPAVTVTTIDGYGVPSHAKEALAFALLGYLTVHGLPGTLPGCTGASAPALLGSITPGSRPLRLPEPAATAPRRLRLVT